MSSPATLGVALAAAAGGLAAVAAREAVIATPAAGRWLADAIEPLRRAGREGYAPTDAERRRLAILGTVAMLAGGLLVVGPGPAPVLAAAGPSAAAWAVARRRTAYRRAVERGLAGVALAVADALAAGRSARAALAAAPSSLRGSAGARDGAGPRRALARRPASPACSSPRCRPGLRCSPSFSIPASSRACSRIRRRRPCSSSPRRSNLPGSRRSGA